MKRKFYQWLFFKAMGWKITGSFPPGIEKCVVIVIPHTSWHDFYIGLLARGIIGLEINWVGKKELFRFPLSIYFRWMGGEPLDRTRNLNKVDSIASIFNNNKTFRLAIAPEGTRKKVQQLRTGFYYIALKAKVPIIPVAFNYKEKEVNIGHPFHPTGNIEQDLNNISKHFLGIEGKIPGCSFLIEEQ